jgi:hypothetical protein
MGNALHQSKRKQPTLKKESQESAKPKNNGDATKDVYLSLEQAALFKQLLVTNNETAAGYRQAEADRRQAEVAWTASQGQIQIALIAAGIPGNEVVGGNLDVEKPYFTIRYDNDVIKK